MKQFGFYAASLLVAAASVVAAPFEQELIDQCRSRLNGEGIDVRERKFSVTYFGSPEAYFRSKPRDDHWNAGREAVGQRQVYAVHYSPVRPTLGGVGTFFFDAKTKKFLWAYRGR